jgi:hypothetical protein
VATELNPGVVAWVRTAASVALTVVTVLVAPLVAGYAFASSFAPTLQSKYFPWITGRALGIAGYLSLWALVGSGVWMRHRWRLRLPLAHGETRLRVHAALGAATVALVIGHLVSLAADPYAGVGWVGAFVPGRSRYRTLPVALGTIAFVFMLVLALTARFAGRRGSRHWLSFHRFSAVTFALVWVHGVLAGTDTAALRLLYAATGATLGALVVTRYWAAPGPKPPRPGWDHLDDRSRLLGAPEGDRIAGAAR